MCPSFLSRQGPWPFTTLPPGGRSSCAREAGQAASEPVLADLGGEAVSSFPDLFDFCPS